MLLNRLILNLNWQDHATAALQQLHWLPIELRIQYKLCVIYIFISPERQYKWKTIKSCTPYITTGDHLIWHLLFQLSPIITINLPDPDFIQLRQHATSSREVKLLESRRFHTLVLQPGINSHTVYSTYQTPLLLENTSKCTFSLVVINFNWTM